MAGEVHLAGRGQPDEGARLARLDGLRGLAACLVAFAYHSRLLGAEGAFAGAGPVIAWFHTWGWTCVDLFFVISGYIFAHAYLGRRQLERPGALADFAVARVARLYPLHLITLVVAAVLFWGRPGNDPANLAVHLLMLQGLARPFAETFNGPSWSLTIEGLCYLVFAVAAARGSRPLAVVTGAAILWGAVMLALHGPPGGPWVHDVLPRGMLGFFIGQALWHGRDRLAQVPGVALAGLLAAALLIGTGPWRWSPVLPLTLLAWPCALLLALRLPLFGSPLMRWLGDRSYAIYLIHMPVLAFVANRFGPFVGGRLVLAHLLLVAGVLVLADMALTRLERPARTAIRAAWGRRRAAERTVTNPA